MKTETVNPLSQYLEVGKGYKFRIKENPFYELDAVYKINAINELNGDFVLEIENIDDEDDVWNLMFKNVIAFVEVETDETENEEVEEQTETTESKGILEQLLGR